MALRKMQTLSVFRSILREIRLANPKIHPVSKSVAVQYLFNEYRCHQVTEKRACKGEDTLNFMAKTYLIYLKSIREYEALFKIYHGRGEKSVKETASLVGLALPKEYKDSNDKNE